MDRPPHSVRIYTSGIDGRVYFDLRRFSLMRYYDDEHFIFDIQVHKEQLTGVGCWAKG